MPIERLAADADHPLSRGARWRCLAGAGGLLFGLFVLGGQPFAAHLIDTPWDKLAHFLCYGALALLARLGLPRVPAGFIVAGVSLVGALDEWHQLGLPGRSADLADFLTDMLAALSALGAHRVLMARWASGAVAQRKPGKPLTVE